MLQKLKHYTFYAAFFMLLALPFGMVSTSYAAPATKPAKHVELGGNCLDISKCDLITKYVNPFIYFLSAFVGVAVVISIIIGGIQYGSSGGDSSKVTAAKNRIRNSILALITYLFLFALLNFLIPGGLL
jgi:uncharacterized membrane protein YjgN (DUF898 family)